MYSQQQKPLPPLHNQDVYLLSHIWSGQWVDHEGQCNRNESQISLCLSLYLSPRGWQGTSDLTCVESDSNCHFSRQESAAIPEMLLKFSKLLYHMDSARQRGLIRGDFYAKMDLNWQCTSCCAEHAYRIRKLFGAGPNNITWQVDCRRTMRSIISDSSS